MSYIRSDAWKEDSQIKENIQINENNHPSSLPARVAGEGPSREKSFGPGAKKDGCFRRLQGRNS